MENTGLFKLFLVVWVCTWTPKVWKILAFLSYFWWFGFVPGPPKYGKYWPF